MPWQGLLEESQQSCMCRGLGSLREMRDLQPKLHTRAADSARALGLTPTGSQLKVHPPRGEACWQVDADGSVASHNGVVDIMTPSCHPSHRFRAMSSPP